MRNVKLVSKVAAAIVLFLIIAFGAFYFYSEYLEIREIGQAYTKVFFTDIFARLEMFGVCFIVSGIIVFINLLFVRRNSDRINGEPIAVLKRKYVLIASALAAVIVSVLFSGGLYRKMLLFLNSSAAGVKEPVFGMDISYYFFTREFLQGAANTLMALLGLMLAANIALYIFILAKDDREAVRRTLTDGGVFLHLAVNVVFIIVLKGATYYLEAQGILLDQSGAAPGALYVDTHIRLPFYNMAPYILFVIAALAAVLLFFKKFKGVIITALVFPALLLIMNGAAFIVHSLYVVPNEVTLESPYIANNIKYTNIGFGLDKVDVRTFGATETLTREKIDQNADIVNNIRITDPLATLDVLNSTKSIRNYYTFTDSDIVEYDIDGVSTAVNIAAREMDVTRLSGNADNYINKTLRYTHGYGIVMNPVNAVTSEGQPECIIQNMPIASEKGAPEIKEPRIYYGEKTNNYCIVNTSMNEFDYALNDQNIESKYNGTSSGIEMNMMNRLIFSLKNADYKMLVSGYINDSSRLLPNRNIIKRVEKAVPFLAADPDPYIVIGEDGKLYWIVDLYTHSSSMPYSTRYSGINYIRNSAKAVVDAYEGTVNVYITDEQDSIIMTYNKIYPGVMKKGGLPDNISAHIRYPEYLFKLQSQVYLRYHMEDPETFYANTDLWMVAKEKYRGTDAINVSPYYNLLSVEDFSEEGAQLVLMQPFVPANKENLVAWIAADNYGNIISYRFPAGRTVYGTLHVENRIDSDATISKELSLWNQGGSTVLRGNILVIPIADSLIYVEPIYITTSNNAAVPEVKRIIMAYGDEVVMEENLEKCFDRIFGGAEKEEETTEPDESEVQEAYDAAAEAIEAYDRAHDAMANGKWEEFGKAMNELDKAINAMRGDETVED